MGLARGITDVARGTEKPKSRERSGDGVADADADDQQRLSNTPFHIIFVYQSTSLSVGKNSSWSPEYKVGLHYPMALLRYKYYTNGDEESSCKKSYQ